MKRYQITRLGAWSSTGNDEVVGTDLTWQQALRFMSGGAMNIDYALASLDHSRTYSFHDGNGSLCLLREYTELTHNDGP